MQVSSTEWQSVLILLHSLFVSARVSIVSHKIVHDGFPQEVNRREGTSNSFEQMHQKSRREMDNLINEISAEIPDQRFRSPLDDDKFDEFKREVATIGIPQGSPPTSLGRDYGRISSEELRPRSAPPSNHIPSYLDNSYHSGPSARDEYGTGEDTTGPEYEYESEDVDPQPPILTYHHEEALLDNEHKFNFGFSKCIRSCLEWWGKTEGPLILSQS